MSKRELLPTPAADLPGVSGQQRGPLFVFMAGRGGTGKTHVVRLLCELCFAEGRSVVIADGDRTNRSLPLFFDGVLSPPNGNHQTVRRWLEGIVEQVIAQRLAVIVDLGGGDTVFREVALELDLQEMLEANGAVPVILHMITPDVESLSVLASLAPELPQKSLFAPERTALILNEGSVPEGFDPAQVFEPIHDHKVFRAAVGRNARVIRMPQLRPAYDINRRHLSFADAAAGRTKDGLPPLGILDRQRVTMWLRAVKQELAPIAEWLP